MTGGRRERRCRSAGGKSLVPVAEGSVGAEAPKREMRNGADGCQQYPERGRSCVDKMSTNCRQSVENGFLISAKL